MTTGTATKTIIVIEDEHSINELLGYVLGVPQFEVIACDTGDKGLNAVVNLKPDLVVLDLMLPGVSGWEIYDYMRQDDDLKDIPIVIMTVISHVDPNRMRQVRRNPISAFMSKPFDMNLFRSTVQDLLKVKIWE